MIDLKRVDTTRARHYRREISGDELFDLMDETRDEMTFDPGRRLDKREWEDTIERREISPRCEELAGRLNDSLTTVDLEGDRLEAHCVVFER